MVDDHSVAALVLSKSTDCSKADGLGMVSHPMEGAMKAAEGEAQNFSMGMTRPTVPARLVRGSCLENSWK